MGKARLYDKNPGSPQSHTQTSSSGELGDVGDGSGLRYIYICMVKLAVLFYVCVKLRVLFYVCVSIQFDPLSVLVCGLWPF